MSTVLGEGCRLGPRLPFWVRDMSGVVVTLLVRGTVWGEVNCLRRGLPSWARAAEPHQALTEPAPATSGSGLTPGAYRARLPFGTHHGDIHNGGLSHFCNAMGSRP